MSAILRRIVILSIVLAAIYTLLNQVDDAFFAAISGDVPVQYLGSPYGAPSAWGDLAVMLYGFLGGMALLVLFLLENWNGGSAPAPWIARPRTTRGHL